MGFGGPWVTVWVPSLWIVVDVCHVTSAVPQQREATMCGVMTWFGWVMGNLQAAGGARTPPAPPAPAPSGHGSSGRAPVTLPVPGAGVMAPPHPLRGMSPTFFRQLTLRSMLPSAAQLEPRQDTASNPAPQ
jgi:hypothetical protein